jgi:prepilin-type N-terminal cleavage/methylation domain-containing protein
MSDHPYPPESRRGGYTLVELLIVIAVLGLAGALLVPHLVDQPSMTVQAAVRQLIADFSFAQSDALAHQEYRRVHVYGDGRGYCLLRVSEGDYAAPFDENTADYVYDPLASAGEAGHYIIDFTADDRFEGVTITSVNMDGGGEGIGGDGGDVVYDPLGGTIRAGGLPGTGGTIVLTADDDDYQVTFSPFTGKLTVQKLGG